MHTYIRKDYSPMTGLQAGFTPWENPGGELEGRGRAGQCRSTRLLLPPCALPTPTLALKAEAVQCLCISCCCKSIYRAWGMILMSLLSQHLGLVPVWPTSGYNTVIHKYKVGRNQLWRMGEIRRNLVAMRCPVIFYDHSSDKLWIKHPDL